MTGDMSFTQKLRIAFETVGEAGLVKSLQRIQSGISTIDKEAKRFGVTNKSQHSIFVQSLKKEAAEIEKKKEQLEDLGKSGKGISQLSEEFKQLNGKLLGASLSMMFFGMAIKRVSDAIWQDSTKTFQDISHRVEGTVTAFDKLEGSMTYLKFVTGQALEPLAELLLPIIDRISDWVSQNPNLIKSAVAFSAIAGSVLVIGGQLGSAVVGITSIAGLMSESATAAVTLKNTLGALAVKYYAVNLILDFADENSSDLSKAANMAKIAGIVSAMTGFKAIGAGIFSIGVVLDLIDAFTNGEPFNIQTLGKILTNASLGVMYFSRTAGAIMLGVGLTLQFVDKDSWKNIWFELSRGFGLIGSLLADLFLNVLALGVNPIIDVINSALDVYSFITGKNVDHRRINHISMGMTRMDDYLDMVNEQRNQRSRMFNESTQPPTSEQPSNMSPWSPHSNTNSIILKLDGQATENLIGGKAVMSYYNQSAGNY